MARSDDKLYHYTSPDGKEGILDDRLIRASTSNVKYGQGVYFTSLRPKNDTETIKKGTFDGWSGATDNRFKWDVVVSRDDLKSAGYKLEHITDPANPDADIYRVPGPQGVDLNKLKNINLNPR